jgi:hypothetical protein
MDLDLISTRFVKRSRIRKAMREIGFSEEGGYFKHPDTEFFIEFLGGPLSVGTGKRDCRTGYYYWDDLQCLEQAGKTEKNSFRYINNKDILLSIHNSVDLKYSTSHIFS